ncbi:MAG: hypothetical protein LBR54_04420, partial [Oscillospiraceae bacterium]|nr:hypothetical protein [Oscillospiraceae bacterium]
GKTHLCTAVCGKLLSKNSVNYMRWRAETPRIKALANTENYAAELDILKKAEVLYIDDFFKGKVTEGDVNIAFDVLDYRYINDLRTVISTEKSIADLCRVPEAEAVSGRIIEKAKGFTVQISHNIGRNYRLKGVPAC